MPAFERSAGAQIAIAGAIDRFRTIEEDDARCHQRSSRRVDHRGVKSCEPVGGGNGVVVEKDEHVAARDPGRRIVAGGKSQVAAVLDDADRWKAAGDKGRGTVARSVVGENHLERRRRHLRGERR